jgi:glutamyl-tRNA synthetase
MPLRFKSDPRDYFWHDEVMGNLSTGPEVIDDFILIKSDGFPTYNFAHIVDDAEMQISHVIRGQEFLASVPNYLNLYDALEIKVPLLATMPHILGPSGTKKLSKRDGAKDVLDYLRDGFLVEALINFIASLGWNDGTEQELFSRSELIKKFSLDHVQKSGARFDEQRLLWMNGHYVRQLSIDDLFHKVKDDWPESASSYDDAYKKRVLAQIQDRLKFLKELPELTRFFFEDLPTNLNLIDDNRQLAGYSHVQLKDLLNQSSEALFNCDFSEAALTDCLNSLLAKTKQKPGVLFSLIRIATTQAPSSPALAPTLSIIGKQKCLSRIATTIAALG